ncbi:MAG: ImmA/IrrE family metallo-endopeptidase [Gammaproteobacteria bacterium AqS3]|nr:ImmA/IrrE family metallo-endopeptidase [Gammaproteobacteria bacterium AqS3]
MSARVEQANAEVLRQCREQLGFEIDEVARKVKSIAAIEADELKPTFKQLKTLSDLYEVPDWVFISDAIPERFRLTSSPSYRLFKKAGAPLNPKVNKLLIRVEQLRELVIDFQEDQDEQSDPFDPPEWTEDVKTMAKRVREWLELDSGNRRHWSFDELREKLEQKDVFILMTSKYNGPWKFSVEEDFRGLCIFYGLLPIVVINDSDNKKAQSFSLIHELGHLLRRESIFDHKSILDDDKWDRDDEERWCDELAEEVLMPYELVNPNSYRSFNELKDKDIQVLAKEFMVSPYVFCFRLQSLDLITEDKANKFKRQIKEKSLSQKASGSVPISRKRHKEALRQFGSIYTKTVWQAYYDDELDLLRLGKLFELNKLHYVQEMRKIIPSTITQSG